MKTLSAFQPKSPTYLRNSTHSLDLESGSSQFAFITNANATGLNITGDMTIEAWVKPESYSSGGSVIASKDTFSSTANDRQYIFYIMEGGADSGKLSFVYWATGNSNETTFRTNSVVLTIGMWSHVAVTIDVSATTAVFYVNGSVVASTKIGGTATSIGSTTVNFNIGKRNGTSTLYFDGIIDDVRVWDDIRTAQEIQDNMLVELQGNESNLVGYWKLNNSYLDETANNNDLTSSGSPVFSTDIPFSILSNTTKAYYPLNGNSIDFSGNGNSGTDTAITYPQGRFGQGARFNGSSSKVTIADSSSLSITGNYTVSFWTRIITEPSTNTIEVWLDKVGASESGGYGIDYYNNAGVMYIRAYHLITTTFYIYSTLQNLGINTWNLITMTYDGANQVLYRNGIRIGGQAQTNNPSDNASSLIMGASGASARFINADMDEVIIESRAWSAKEVETYYRKSMLNYKTSVLAKLLQSFSILEDISLSETISSLRARNFSVSETTTLTESITTALGKIFTIIENVSLSEVLSTSRSFLFNVLESVNITEIKTSLETKWNNIKKNISNFTNQSKNSSSWSNDSKNNSNWTNQNKN